VGYSIDLDSTESWLNSLGRGELHFPNPDFDPLPFSFGLIGQAAILGLILRARVPKGSSGG